MNINKDKTIIKSQSNEIRYVNGRINEILGGKIQTNVFWEKKIFLILYSSKRKKTLGSSNCVQFGGNTQTGI